MATIRFSRSGAQYVVAFRYDAGLVDLIKTVPGYARTYDPTTRQWHIDSYEARQLAAAMQGLGHTVVGLEQPRHEPPKRAAISESDWARALFRRLGSTRSDAAYRALSKVCHPDIGGDTALQRELNTAYDELGHR